MTERIRDFLRARRHEGLDEGPVLVVDTEVVRDNYAKFARALPNTRVFYAVKANPEPAVLKLLADLGSCFDTASVVEVQLALSAGATADPHLLRQHDQEGARRSPARSSLASASSRVDCEAEVEKVSRAAAAAGLDKRDVRVLLPHPMRLRRRRMAAVAKFGCAPEMAIDVLEHAYRLGLEAYGVSFHVGSQQRNTESWDVALASASAIFPRMRRARASTSRWSISGGGFPTKYLKDIPAVEAYGESIFRALSKHFGNRLPETIIEPGRGMVGNAGIIESEVVLVSKKSTDEDEVRWVYLDIGKFGGLAETMDESIRYPIRDRARRGPHVPCVLAGPTCDSADVLYEKEPYFLPISIEIGDKV
jgi:ornithine decarboxylase